jgi:hypothetical protein
MRKFSDKYLDKIKTHIQYSITFSNIRAFHEIMWTDTVWSNRPQMAKQATDGNTVQRKRFACWINEATVQTHTQNT